MQESLFHWIYTHNIYIPNINFNGNNNQEMSDNGCCIITKINLEDALKKKLKQKVVLCFAPYRKLNGNS